jgi:ER-bound oxygenase mpaB/B'/Rubber oxygenase, catalytic domain
VTSRRWTAETLRELRRHGDPELDGLIAELVEADERSVLELFEATVQAQMATDPEQWPPALRAWWERPALPEWMDRDKVARANEVSHDWLPELLTSYLVGSLPLSYAGVKGAKVLTRISLLRDEDRVVRRVLETLLFVLRVVEPDALEVGGTGYELARKTRVFHGLVRSMVGTFGIDRREDDGEGAPWDPEADGVPVNQEDLLGTLWTFAVTPLQVIMRAEIPVAEADRDAVTHLWCVVGHLLGIGAGLPERLQPLLPLSFDEAADCWAAIQDHQFGPSEDGRTLTDVLIARCRESIPLPFLRDLPEASVYDTLGPRVAGYVGVGRQGPIRHLLLVNRLAFRLANAVPGGDLLRAPVRHFAKRFALEWLTQERAGDRARPVDELTDAQRRALKPLYLTPGARRAVAGAPTVPGRPAPSTPVAPGPSR